VDKQSPLLPKRLFTLPSRARTSLGGLLLGQLRPSPKVINKLSTGYPQVSQSGLSPAAGAFRPFFDELSTKNPSPYYYSYLYT